MVLCSFALEHTLILHQNEDTSPVTQPAMWFLTCSTRIVCTHIWKRWSRVIASLSLSQTSSPLWRIRCGRTMIATGRNDNAIYLWRRCDLLIFALLISKVITIYKTLLFSSFSYMWNITSVPFPIQRSIRKPQTSTRLRDRQVLVIHCCVRVAVR